MNVEYTKISPLTSCGKRTSDRERRDCMTVCALSISIFSLEQIN